MGELYVLLLIPLLAVLIDLIHSYVSVPSVWPLGMLSSMELNEVEAARADGEEVAADADGQRGQWKVFLFAIQNNEAVPVESSLGPILVRIAIRGMGQFRGKDPIRLFAGPGYEAHARWLRVGEEIELSIPRLRPLKTWAFRCYVDPSVHEMSMTMLLPTKSYMRKLLQRINEGTFRYPEVDYHRYVVVVRTKEDAFLSRKPFQWTKNLVRTVGLTFFATVSLYWVAIHSIMKTYRTDSLALPLWHLQNDASLTLDVLILLVGLGVIYVVAQPEPMPVAQGYQAGAGINPVMPQAERRS